MSGIVHISEAANLGLHAMILIAGRSEEAVRSRDIAAALGASEDHLAKVMQGLVRSGLVTSTRGPRGGFKLQRPAADIRLLDIYESIEGEMRPKACLLGMPRCAGQCVLGDFIVSTNEAFRRQFASTRLSDVAGAIPGAPRKTNARTTKDR